MAGAASDVEDGDVREETPRDPGLGKPTAVFGSIAGNQVTFGPSGAQPTRRNVPRISCRRPPRCAALTIVIESNRPARSMVPLLVFNASGEYDSRG
jgi:hypothetical protein